MEVYPLKFKPIYKPKIWGGRSLERLFGRDLPAGPVGESWELADIPEGTSVLANGPLTGMSLTELIRRLGSRLIPPFKDGSRFPLLFKYLDAEQTLSLQVHPDHKTAARLGGSTAGKNECWYVVESRGGFIYKGLKMGVTAGQFRQALRAGAIEGCLNRIEVGAGEFHFLPAGTVHALGCGVVAAEVQTASDSTFRLHDWGRGRDLQVEQALQCMKFTAETDVGEDITTPPKDGLGISSPYFSVHKRRAEGCSASLPAGRCTVLMFLPAAGVCEIRHAGPAEPILPVLAGDTVLVPAGCQGVQVVCDGRCEWLEIIVPRGSGGRDQVGR